MPHGLLTDLYELTMAAGYVAAGKSEERATFELFVRRLPPGRDFLLAAGLEQAVEYLLGLDFPEDEIRYLRGLAQFQRAPEAFFESLRRFRFTGDVFAVPEGTPVFGGEPLMTVRAPILEAQIPETYLLATISFQTMIASKAVRVVSAAAGKAVVEFGTRRAHSPQAGVLAARAAYLGGCEGTSNTQAGYQFGIPVYGTAAHSWVQSFPREQDAFRRLQDLLGSGAVYLVDTYDTVEGARRAAALGPPLWGVRLDSGDLAALATEVRAVLDRAGLEQARIMASGDLNEERVRALEQARAPIDVYGVGTDLATSGDAPSLGAVYKLVEIESNHQRRITAKFSPEKRTWPGAKQVFRFPTHDVIGTALECAGCDGGSETSTALLRPVILGGKLVEPLPGAAEIRTRAAAAVAAIAPLARSYSVEHSAELNRLADEFAAGQTGSAP